MLKQSMARSRTAVAPYDGRVRLIDGAGPIVAGLTLEPMPGHTVGHSGVLVGDEILIVGDVFHQPCLQAARPDWACVFDADKTQAAETRRAVLARAADAGLVIAGMHLDAPGFARVRRDGEAFALSPVPAPD